MAIKRQLYHIGIVGSYSGLNLGDEAILQSIVQQIRASIKARITVFSRVGQAAGICAALAALNDTQPRRLAPAEVQRELLRQGANLRDIALH